jgi:Mn2+/Fe2+ NRAMP family transporter
VLSSTNACFFIAVAVVRAILATVSLALQNTQSVALVADALSASQNLEDNRK